MPRPAQFRPEDLARAFGLANFRAFQQPPKEAPAPQVDYQTPTRKSDEVKELRRTLINAPVYTEVRFLPLNYTALNERGEPIQRTTPELALDAAFVSIGQQKTVVNSAPANFPGTVKVTVQNGDWMVSVKGAFWHDTDPDAYPWDQLRRWRDLLECPKAVPVAGQMLEVFGITHLFINGGNVPETQYTNVQFIELQCASDTPPELLREPAPEVSALAT